MSKYQIGADMFERVMDWLETESGEESTGFADQDIQIAVAALFYHMVAVDGVVTEAETNRLRQLLKRRFKLNEQQLSALAHDGEQSDKTSAGLFPFTVILNQELTDRQREKIFDQLHSLSLADGNLHPLESDMLDHVRILLKLPSK